MIALRTQWLRGLIAATLCAVSGRGLGLDAMLSSAEVQQAVRSGQSMVSPLNGYMAAPYVLHEYTNGIRIDPTSPLVDALTIGTPYERVRYYSYLEAFQKKPVRLGNAAKVGRDNAGRLTIIAFTHSPDTVQAELEAWQQTYVKHGDERKVQRTYLDDFKPATLTAGGRTFTSKITIQGPFQDSFTTKGSPEFRYIGVVYFQFDLSSLARQGKISGVADLKFSDPKGRTYTQRIDLAHYR